MVGGFDVISRSKSCTDRYARCVAGVEVRERGLAAGGADAADPV
jgi:hypothetical protein